MDRNIFLTAYPQAQLRAEESLGVALFTNIQLIDYHFSNTSNQTKAIEQLFEALPESVTDDLRVLKTVFAHGVILRDYYIRHTKNLTQDWETFIGWWEALDEDAILELVVYGIQESMNYYYKYLPSMPAVEEIMQEVSLATDQLKDDRNRHNALKAVLVSWSVGNIDEILPLYQDANGIKKRILNLLTGVWESGFREIWKHKRNTISDWKSANASLLKKSSSTNIEAIYKVTGLYPDIDAKDGINRAETITFIPVPNMARLMTFYECENHIFLMFEPSISENVNKSEVLEGHDLYLAFEGLGDASRLQIINLLAEHKEMYAQEIVNQSGMSQSTVSRQLNQLHQSNLVTVRQEGNTKYFSLNKVEVAKVIEALETLLK